MVLMSTRTEELWILFAYGRKRNEMISISILHLRDLIVSGSVALMINLKANLFRPPDTDMAHESLVEVVNEQTILP
jgi:hypothetical protein